MLSNASKREEQCIYGHLAIDFQHEDINKPGGYYKMFCHHPRHFQVFLNNALSFTIIKKHKEIFPYWARSK